jgi:hypothetical protein
MSDIETLFVSWPVGIALSCWLFFEITKLGPCLEQSVVPRRVVARSFHQNMELCLMPDVLNPFILWPIGVALGGLLFFEIAKHCWRVDPVPRAFEARSKAIGPAWPAATLPARPERSGQADLHRLNEY